MTPERLAEIRDNEARTVCDHRGLLDGFCNHCAITDLLAEVDRLGRELAAARAPAGVTARPRGFTVADSQHAQRFPGGSS